MSTTLVVPWVVLALVSGALAAEDCVSSASVVGAVLGTIILLLALEVGAYLLWRLYWRSRRGQHLVLVTDPEKGGDYAFDNPCFKDATPVSKAVLDSKEPCKGEQKNKWTSWGGLGAIKNNLGGLQGEKRRAVDDSFPAEPQVTQVSLRSHDFTGLGFNICGNMRDGIFVKDVLHHGPAAESGMIFPGDRIHGIRISLRHMVFEDALTILSYASPYEVTLDVETGCALASSRPSSLLRREQEKEKEALAQAGIVHPYYRSQSIADLAQIGKGTPKRPHAVDCSPGHGRSDNPSDYPTLKLMAAAGAGPHTSTPREHVRHEGAAAVITPSSNVVVKPERGGGGGGGRVQRLGVRVLPAPDLVAAPAEPSEKRQNVHNTYLERGIDVPDGYNPYTAPASRPSSGGFHDVDLSGGSAGSGGSAADPALEEADAHHRVSDVAKEVKTKISKGIHSLLHSLDRKKKDEAVPASPPSPPRPAEAVSEEVLIRKPSGRGIPTEIPEEVRLAAMAARNNRKSFGALSVEVEAEAKAEPRAEPRAVSRNSSASGDSGQDLPPHKKPSKRKGLAPCPPSASPQAAAEDTPPLGRGLVNGGEEPHSDSDSEVSGPRTTIELTSSHITIHHSPLSDEETTRKAASLGDLSRIEDKLAGVALLERAVSLDLVDGTPSGKKRKAPAAPADDDDLLLPDLEVEKASRKEPRLDLGLNTFERSRLKKSSDWGTMEEALNEQVFVLPPAPTVAEVIPKGEMRSSFFVGLKFGHPEAEEQQQQQQQQDQPFSFTATAAALEPQPLSIEVRSEPADSSERDRVLWSRVSVATPPPPAEQVDSIVSSTPLPAGARPSSDLQSPLITSSDLARPSYVTTTQLNSLEDADLDEPSRSDAFLTAVDSTLLADSLPDLPTSPVPVSGSPYSSLTYITEIQVTTPDSSAPNGFPAPDSPSPSPPPQPKVNGCAEPPPADSTPSSSAAATSPTTSTPSLKAGKNVSVTAIQGSRIPVRASSASTPTTPTASSTPTTPTTSPMRPPVPARRTTDLSPRKANGVQVINSHPTD